MSIFSSIISKIFPSSHPAVAQTQGTPAAGASVTAGTSVDTSNTASSNTATSPAVTETHTASIQEVDVEAILNEMARNQNQTLNWRTSIIDLLKLLNLDSSLQSRTALAHELAYSGDTGDSAAMNIWLHKQVMSKLAENGGRVPADLQA